MKGFKFLILFFSFCFSLVNCTCTDTVERHIVIVVASYNNKDWYKHNLDSILAQDYSNYNVIYVDDCSPDGTGKLVAEYIKEKDIEHRIQLICNEERCGALANQYKAIHSCDDMSIVIICIDNDNSCNNLF